MRERVSVIQGNQPILLVAPHGADDINTDILTEQTAHLLDCYAVINRGFDRADFVDVNDDKADCNRVDHIIQDVVYDEFLKPILKIKNRVIYKPSTPFSHGGTQKLLILYVHGVGDNIHRIANEPVDMIVGCGRGTKKDSFTCKTWRKNLLIDTWRSFSNAGAVYEGKGGGKYAGRSANNVNQYFRKHQLDRNVESMQLEFPYSRRNSLATASATARLFYTVLTEFLGHGEGYDLDPQPKFI